MDKLRAMATFVRIVDGGSLTAAADAAGTSLTSVVRSLAALEQSLGTRLLNRTTRRLSLTAEGRDYAERCRQILAAVDEADAALGAQKGSLSGRLALTAPVTFGRLHVAPVVASFLQKHPDLSVELLLLDRVVDLLEEGLDLAIRIGQLPDSSLVAVPLGSIRRVCCASPAYLRRHGTPRAPLDLLKHRCIGFKGSGPGSDWRFKVEGRTVKVPVTPVFVTNQIEASVDAGIAGLGCVSLLHYQARAGLASGALKTLLREYEVDPLPVHILYRPDRLMSTRVRALLDWLAPRLRESLASDSVG
ncbi:LysR family transcriptional regulator [Hydrogenophaga sp. XSHU_21]|jgi:DNA-binding transcriptional LysR family regulator